MKRYLIVMLLIGYGQNLVACEESTQQPINLEWYLRQLIQRNSALIQLLPEGKTGQTATNFELVSALALGLGVQVKDVTPRQTRL